MTSRRVCCCVPFCQRTRGDRKNDPLPENLDGLEWICAEHWKAVSGQLRAIYRRAHKAEAIAQAIDAEACRAVQSAFPNVPTDVEQRRWVTVWRAVDATSRARRVWRICKRRAIEAAAGI